MSNHAATRRYNAPQFVDRGRIIEQTLMSFIVAAPEDDTGLFTEGTSI